MFYDDIGLKFFYVDRKNHNEICKQHGLDIVESYLIFTEIWNFRSFWIYEESSLQARIERVRKENEYDVTTSTGGSIDPDPWETLDRLMESFANNYLKEREYDLDGVRIECESEPIRPRQAD